VALSVAPGSEARDAERVKRTSSSAVRPLRATCTHRAGEVPLQAEASVSAGNHHMQKVTLQCQSVSFPQARRTILTCCLGVALLGRARALSSVQ